MQASQIPSKVPLPFANSGTKNAIPTASQIGITAGAASLTDGFPPLTMTPLSSGGVPPAGADFNGILNLVTAVQQWQSAGGIFKYDATFSTAIGGYPQGAVLMSSANASLWLNLVDNNTTNPDSGGANWISLSAGRLLNLQIFSANGTYTPTTGTKTIQVEVMGGGGAGGAAASTGAGQIAGGAGGGAGGRAIKRMAVPAAQAITIGGGGVGNNSTVGGAGGTSSFGAIVSATGGVGGNFGTAGAGGGGGGAAGGNGSGGDINIPGGAGGGVFGIGANGIILSGKGADTPYGAGGANISGYATGPSASGLGAGGAGGACAPSSGGAASGGNGSAGLIIIYEYA